MKLSRSAIEQFIRCPRCFYQQRRLGLKQPSMVPLTLAVATDALLKNEFDAIRGQDVAHAVWQQHGLNVRAYVHPDMELWRNNFKGIRVQHNCGAEVFGAVDDVWENLDTGELHIVDYKSTSKQGEPSIDVGWGAGYKRQMEIYQWLFRQAGHKVSNTGYFLYVNGSKQGGFYASGTEGVMRFATTLIAYDGDVGWVDAKVNDAAACFNSGEVPESGSDCDNCRYFEERLALGEAASRVA
jgi:hypothetical protein